ncbi:MAG: oligosaccharide flippase family protein [Candidatus Paceibacterota bacterium]
METILLHFEKFFKTDMHYLLRGGSWLTVGQIVATGTSLILSVIFARFLPKETYGTYQYVLSIFGILSLATLSGINIYLQQAVARGLEGSTLIAFYTKVKWGTLASIGSVSVGLYYLYFGNTTLSFSFFVAAPFLPFMDALSVSNIYLQGKKLFGPSIRYYSVSQIGWVTMIVAAVVFTKNLPVIILAYCGGATLVRYIIFRRTFEKYPPNGEKDPNVVSYGKHLSAVSFATTISLFLDTMLVFHYLGPVQTAIYALATAPADQIRALAKNIGPLAVPKLAQRSFKEIDAMLYTRLFQLALLGGAMALTYILLAPLFFKILYPNYMEAVFYSQLFALNIILRISGNFFNAAMQSKMHYIPKSWLYFGMIPQIVFILGVFLLIQRYGIIGIFAASFFSASVSSFISFIQWKVLLCRHKENLDVK